MEFWSLSQKKLTEKIDCQANIYISIKFINDFIFLLNDQEEFVLWDAIEYDTIQRRTAPELKEIVKIELYEKDCLILYKNGSLEFYDVQTGEN